MAVGKSSMARAARTGEKKSPKKIETRESSMKNNTTKTTSKSSPVKETAVIASCDEAVVNTIVYEECSQVLKRDAEPGESFGIGDSMPIYYL